MVEIDSAPRLNAVCRGKKSASVRQADVPTDLNQIWPRQKNLQYCDKNKASVRQPLLYDFAHSWRFIFRQPRYGLLQFLDFKGALRIKVELESAPPSHWEIPRNIFS